MFINPKQAIEEGWLRNVEESWIQPNAVDIPMTELYKLDTGSVFEVFHNDKTHRDRAFHAARNGIWTLKQGLYDFISTVYVDMPHGYVGWLRTRSTFNRNGCMVHSGLYDSGFSGPVCGMLYNHGGTTKVEAGFCVAQFIIGVSDSYGTYAGGYNTEEGKLPNHIKK